MAVNVQSADDLPEKKDGHKTHVIPDLPGVSKRPEQAIQGVRREVGKGKVLEQQVQARIQEVLKVPPEPEQQPKVPDTLDKWPYYDDFEKNAKGAITKIGPYQFIKKLGKGGFANVFLARDERTGEEVAVKIEHPKEERQLKRILNEALVHQNHQHPNIMPILDVGSCPNPKPEVYGGVSYFLVMPVAKTTLQDKLEVISTADRASKIAFAKKVIPRLVRGIRQLHRYHLHLDIKPANIFIDQSGNPMIGDFGLSIPETEKQKILPGRGTPDFMAPEQFSPKDIDETTDYFGLAISMLQALTGKFPFKLERTSHDVMRARFEYRDDPKSSQDIRRKIREQIILSDTPKHVGEVLIKMIHGKREKRIPEAELELALLRAVERDETESPKAQAQRLNLKKQLQQRASDSGSTTSTVHQESAKNSSVTKEKTISDSAADSREPISQAETKETVRADEVQLEPIEDPKEALQLLEREMKSHHGNMKKKLNTLSVNDKIYDYKGRIFTIIEKSGTRIIAEMSDKAGKRKKRVSLDPTKFDVLARNISRIESPLPKIPQMTEKEPEIGDELFITIHNKQGEQIRTNMTAVGVFREDLVKNAGFPKWLIVEMAPDKQQKMLEFLGMNPQEVKSILVDEPLTVIVQKKNGDSQSFKIELNMVKEAK